MRVIGRWLFYNENAITVRSACHWAAAGLHRGDRERGCKAELKWLLCQMLLLGGEQQGDLPSKSEWAQETGEQSIVYIRGKTAPLLNDLQQQAVQEQLPLFHKWITGSKIKHLDQIWPLSRTHTFTRNQTCLCLRLPVPTVLGKSFEVLSISSAGTDAVLRSRRTVPSPGDIRFSHASCPIKMKGKSLVNEIIWFLFGCTEMR